MNLFVELLILFLTFGCLFSIIPKFTYLQVKKLLTYHKYKEEVLKKRFIKVIRVYVILGLALGFVFAFLLSGINPKIEDLNKKPVFLKDSIELIGLSFFTSFLLVVILRISTLLNKSKIASFILPKKMKEDLLKKSQFYDYSGLREEIKSFLFSIFLTALLGLMIYFVYNLLFNPSSILIFSFKITYESILRYLIFLVIFIFALIIITFFGEWLLRFIGVHPKCEDEISED